MKNLYLFIFIILNALLNFSTDAFAFSKEGYLVCKGHGPTREYTDDIGACVNFYRNDANELCTGSKSEGLCLTDEITSICKIAAKKTGIAVEEWYSGAGWQTELPKCLSICEESFGGEMEKLGFGSKCHGLILDKSSKSTTKPIAKIVSNPEVDIETKLGKNDSQFRTVINNLEVDVKATHYSAEELTVEEYDKLLEQVNQIKASQAEPQINIKSLKRIVEPVSKSTSEPQPEFDLEQQANPDRNESNNSSSSLNVHTNSGGIEVVPDKEPVSSTFAVCWQGRKKIVPGNQHWFCDGRIQKTWTSDKTIDVGLKLVGCDNPHLMDLAPKGVEQGDQRYIFSCANPYEKYQRDVLAHHGLSGGNFTYYRNQLKIDIVGAAFYGYESAVYRPGMKIGALPPLEDE